MTTLSEQVMRSCCTIREMLADRGIDAQVLAQLGPAEIEQLVASNVFTLTINPSLNVVFYLVKMRVGEFKNAVANEEEDAAKAHIFVFKEPVSAINKANVLQRFPKAQVFWIGELLFNVTKHRLVPRHERLSPEEVKDVMQKYNMRSKAQFPIIHQDDPVAKYYGLSAGDVVRIDRPSTTASTYSYYRMCT